MAIQDLTAAQQIVQRFAEAIRDEPVVKQLSALGEMGRVEPGRESVDFWVFLDAADEEVERRIVDAASSQKEQSPDTYIMLHLIVGQLPSDFDPLTEVYDGAEQIPLTRP